MKHLDKIKYWLEVKPFEFLCSFAFVLARIQNH